MRLANKAKEITKPEPQKQLFEINMPNTYVLGADIGVSHITTALINLETGTVLPDTLVRLEVDSHGTREEIIDVWLEALLAALGSHQVPGLRLGISMPEPL